MGFFRRRKTNDHSVIDFALVDSNAKAEEYWRKGLLYPVYLMPLRFNGEESEMNRLFVPKEVMELKDRYDTIVEDLVEKGKVDGYSCRPVYKGKSFIPSQLIIEASKDEKSVFLETIKIW